MQSAHNGAATTRIAAKVEERRLLRRRRARGKLSRARPPRLNSGATDTDMLFSPKNWVRPARREARVPNGAGATTGVTGSGCRRHEAGEGEVQGGGRGGGGGGRSRRMPGPRGRARWPRPAAVESHAGTLSGSTAAATPRTATRPHRSPPAAELLVQPRCPGGRRGR
ncbi:unnamed protein product [Prorocentrum cordatum]|uniref:Uncharacterized protein n=1 Tax=Prorocentrum cordatum TaxID=2364126 RepID=A0ABN9YFQ8_9DINO|nr:unnamed protein product [Polarella glacialis]